MSLPGGGKIFTLLLLKRNVWFGVTLWQTTTNWGGGSNLCFCFEFWGYHLLGVVKFFFSKNNRERQRG